MALSDVVKSGARSAFLATGDIPKTVIYIRNISGTYNTTTGINSDIESKQTLKHGGILSNYTRGEVTGNVLATDSKLIILQEDLAVVPGKGDQCDVDDCIFMVEHHKQDPAGATWTLQLRAK